MNIIVPDQIDLTDDDKVRLQQLGEVTLYEDIPETEAETIQRVAGAELITPSWIDITENVIQATPSLKYIVVPAVGYDQIDVRAATAAGVKVANCPTHNARAVAEFTIGLIFAVTRRLLESHLALRQGEWDPRRYQGFELQGKTLTLIGHGTIGKAVAHLAQPLGMTVQWASSKTSPEQLDQLVASADIVSLHLPLTPSSKHLLDRRRLALMKPGAYLINTARGAIVDQSALLQVLKEKRIAGAALDVFDGEPVTGGPNAQIQELIHLENVVATPHIAYNTEETVARLGAELLQTIQACMSGQPINLVN